MIDDPAYFDLEDANQRLREPYFVLRDFGVDPRLVDLVNRLRYTAVGEDLAARAVSLITFAGPPDELELSAALRAQWWLCVFSRALDDRLFLMTWVGSVAGLSGGGMVQSGQVQGCGGEVELGSYGGEPAS